MLILSPAQTSNFSLTILFARVYAKKMDNFICSCVREKVFLDKEPVMSTFEPGKLFVVHTRK